MLFLSLLAFLLLARGELTSAPTLCGDGILGENEQCDDGNKLDGDGCTATCIIEEGWSCAQSGACCREMPAASGMGPMTCYNGFWVATDSDGSMKRDFTTPSNAQIDVDAFLCGRITINGVLEVSNNATLTVAGTLVVPDGSVLSFPAPDPYDHGKVVIVESCGAPGVSGNNNGELIMEEGSMIRILGLTWTDDLVKAGGHEYHNFVTVQHTADTASGVFRLEAPRIPHASNSFPFMASGAQVVNSPHRPFDGYELDLDGGCSDIDLYHQSNGTWGYIWITVNRKEMCESTIVGLAVGIPLGIAVLLVAVFVITSGGAGAGEDYVGL